MSTDTGDTSYNAETVQAIDWQAGTNGNFMPSNQTTTEGNDDQVFWAFAAMTAAEHNFESPASGYPSWVAMAQAVFNEQATRWDTQTCNGGLRWQIFPTNSGYDYRNTVANGGFFQLAARLGRYTGNQTYIDWAEKAWGWFSTSVLFDNSTYQINDGTSDLQNCTSADHQQWSYNYGIYMCGLAFLYNQVSRHSPPKCSEVN
jgi:mannan endo-1,6-alpha-mannosidase